MFFDLPAHLKPARPFEIADQKRALWLQYAMDFTQHRKRIVESVKRRIRDHEIEISGLQSHLSRIANLEKRAVAQSPHGGGLSRAIDHHGGTVHADRVKVFILPQNFQRNEPDPRADVENHAALNAEAERAPNEFIFAFCGIFEGARINESIDFVRCFEFERSGAGCMGETVEETHSACSRRSSSSMRTLFSTMYF